MCIMCIKDSRSYRGENAEPDHSLVKVRMKDEVPKRSKSTVELFEMKLEAERG